MNQGRRRKDGRNESEGGGEAMAKSIRQKVKDRRKSGEKGEVMAAWRSMAKANSVYQHGGVVAKANKKESEIEKESGGVTAHQHAYQQRNRVSS